MKTKINYANLLALLKKTCGVKNNQELLTIAERLYDEAKKKKSADVYRFESRCRNGMSAETSPEFDQLK